MKKLQPGDCVSIIAPASRQPEDSLWMLEAGVQVLKGWGLRVNCNFSASERYFYLAGDDSYRAEELLRALNDPDVKAVFTTRGGYGCARILPELKNVQKRDPKYLIGYSDICALMSACSIHYPQIVSVHGPSVATNSFLGESETSICNRNRLYSVLFSANSQYQQSIEVIRTGSLNGPLVGGNLSILVSLLATPNAPNFDDKVLFLEDVGEKPYSIDRMLTQLAQAGKLDCVKGIVFGDLTGCTDSSNNVYDVIADVLAPYKFPVVSGFKAGHGTINTAFRIGQEINVDFDRKLLQLTG